MSAARPRLIVIPNPVTGTQALIDRLPKARRRLPITIAQIVGARAEIERRNWRIECHDRLKRSAVVFQPLTNRRAGRVRRQAARVAKQRMGELRVDRAEPPQHRPILSAQLLHILVLRVQVQLLRDAHYHHAAAQADHLEQHRQLVVG